MSKERYDEIAAELHNLINVEYPRIKDELSEARAQGDLSENFEYRAARRAQGKAISRIRFLQKVLQHSRVIDRSALPKDRISLLSKVEFTHLGTNRKMTCTIVSHHEMNLEAGKMSIKESKYDFKSMLTNIISITYIKSNDKNIDFYKK